MPVHSVCWLTGKSKEPWECLCHCQTGQAGRHLLSPADHRDISVMFILCVFPCQRNHSKGGPGDCLVLSQLGREWCHTSFLFHYFKITQLSYVSNMFLFVCEFSPLEVSANISVHLQSQFTMNSTLSRSWLCPGKMFCSRKD